MPKLTKAEQKAIANVPATAEAGRKYLCIGPCCWGKGVTPEDAVANAKKNRAGSTVEGRLGWRFILFNIDSETQVDDMGSLCYVPKVGVQPYVEVARFNM